ncbi:hypothetical protein ACFYXM_23165 [Streptomyces sp. NPDC002476]|uniref:hypothetical protein n=1 Tax=Streptomyces sp. NPDC002476 TaxID=3364648 RepID=UPI0036A419AE
MTEFTGWGAEFKEFFGGLGRDNSKDCFEAHRELLWRAVREPAGALAAAPEPRYGAGRVFRLDRDLRLSADHSHIRLLRHRSLTADRTWPTSAWLGGPGVLDLISGARDRAAPLRDWLTHPQSGWSPT